MLEPTYRDELAEVHLGDAVQVLRALPDSCVDAIVTDPPAGISFMGSDWDTFPTRRRPGGHAFADGRGRPALAGGQEHRPGSRAAFVAWLTEVMVEGLRVIPPGGHALVWAIPRTSHWTATAIEDAGFEVRDVVHHLFGQGFPKSLDVGRAIERSGSADAERWRGWGTALKPAAEHWVLARRPLAGRSVAANVLEHGTGALNVDGCRVAHLEPTQPPTTRRAGKFAGAVYASDEYSVRMADSNRGPAAGGRWPADVVLSHAGGCDAWECVEGCPVDELDRQSGVLRSGFMAAGTEREGLGYRGGLGRLVRNDTHGDGGGASRFFYVAKASAGDRDAGLVGERNRHPTVKPVALMRWLLRLVTPPGGLVLDCFAGSGSTLVAAKLEGFRSIGVERDPDSARTCARRLAWATHQMDLIESEGWLAAAAATGGES